MESRAAADMQQNDEKSVERLMDEHLKANGLYRKKIAKDGSCLFRAVAEQVLHCQGLHNQVRAECVKYLRQKRDMYESFIEGDFEVYLHMLQDPQSWVGQVEISALSVLYKHDFIIYQQPGEPPVNITENGYTDKVLLCFLNGNHYDSVYPMSSVKTAAMCQSILYELLYERVYGVDRNVLLPSLRASRSIEAAERESSGDSDLDEGEDFWSKEATACVSNRKAYKGRGRGQARGVGRGCLRRKVQESLSPAFFRNVEYDVWLRSKQVQQRRDFCMAAGMHYKAGDKCQVILNNSDRSYSAYIQDVSPEDGPVTVFIEELGEKHSVPLWNLRTPSEWSTVMEKTKKQTASSSNGPSERDTRPGRKPMRSVSHGSTASSGSAPAGNLVQQQHSWPPQTTVDPPSLGEDGTSRKSVKAGVCASPVEENALLELLNKDEENFPTLEASAQAASIEGSRRAEKKSSRRKMSAVSDTKEPSVNPVLKADRGKQAKKGSVDQDQRSPPPPREEPNPTPSTASPVPSAPKATRAASASTTAPARVPYKASSLAARIPPLQAQSSSASSKGPPVSSQTTPAQSQTAPAPFKPSPVSSQTTPAQSQTPPAPSKPSPVSSQTTLAQSQTAPPPSKGPPGDVQSTRMQSAAAPPPSKGPLDALQATPVQSQTRPQGSFQAPSTRPIILFGNIPAESQDAFEPSEVLPVSPHATVVQPQTLPLPATSVPTQVISQCTPTTCVPVPKLTPMTPTSGPQKPSQATRSQVSDPTAAVATPVPINSVSDSATTFIPPQTPTIPLFPTTPALSPLSTAPTFQTGPVPAPSQITPAAEVPGSTDLPAPSESPDHTAPESDSAGVPTTAHVPCSSPPPAQPAPPLASTCSVGFGTHPPYPPYPPYPAYPAPAASSSPNISSLMPDPCAPPAVPTPPFSHAADPYLYDSTVSPVAGAGGALLSDPPPQLSLTLAHVCQDSLYPGFPRNDKGELVQPPPFSHDGTGKDLPSDMSVLRFFFNLGVKAYLYQMLPPVSYLAPLVHSYHHIRTTTFLPQPSNSRAIFTSPNPLPAGSTPVSHFDIRGVVQTPPPMDVGMFNHHSLPVQMPLPVASHPPLYTGMHPIPPAGPSLQYSAPPPPVGPQQFPVPAPHHYGMEIPAPTVPSIMEAGQRGQRSLTPQLEKTFWTGQGQPHSEGGGVNTGAAPVTVETQHLSGAQAVLGGGGPGQTAEPAMLANGNRRERSGGFIGSSSEDWDAEKAEFGDADLKTGRSYHNQSYRSGGRHAQNDRGGYRGRGSRGKRENTGWGRQDGHLPYHRGPGGRNRGRGFSNTRVTGNPGGQFAPVPES